jgi:hypothetical protein
MGNYPWLLKLVHEGGSTIRVERDGCFFCFNPTNDFQGVSVVIGHEANSLTGVRQTISLGTRPKVVCNAELADVLESEGTIELQDTSKSIHGIEVGIMNYIPCKPKVIKFPRIPSPSAATKRAKNRVLRMTEAISEPSKTVKNIINKESTKRLSPAIVELGLPSGQRLLHLNLSLHSSADTAWVKKAQERFSGADWVVFGTDWGQESGLFSHLKGFKGKRYIFADLVNDSRRERGLPINTMTPIADKLIDQGLDIHLFPPQASLRFEK